MRSMERSRYSNSPQNPFAPPDRRYRLARSYVRNGTRSSFHDDGATREITRYLRRRDEAGDDNARAQLRREYHDLSIACGLHHGRERNLRPLLEAYILAEAKDDAIAVRVGVAPEAIRWFRLAFYDVAHLLASPVYVQHRLIGITDEDGNFQLDA